MTNNYPLYSVIVDGVEVATVGSDDDAKVSCVGRGVKFIDNERTRRYPTKRRGRVHSGKRVLRERVGTF